jgi:hypothetical protein
MWKVDGIEGEEKATDKREGAMQLSIFFVPQQRLHRASARTNLSDFAISTKAGRLRNF